MYCTESFFDFNEHLSHSSQRLCIEDDVWLPSALKVEQMLIHLPTKWEEKAEAKAHLDSISPAGPRFPRLPPALSPSRARLPLQPRHFRHPRGAETERALTPPEIRLLERKCYYKERIAQKIERKVMGRDGNKTNQNLKNKSVLNRHEMKPLGSQTYFCVTAEPSIGNIVSLVFKQILRKRRTGIFIAEWRGTFYYFSLLFYIFHFDFGRCYKVSSCSRDITKMLNTPQVSHYYSLLVGLLTNAWLFYVLMSEQNSSSEIQTKIVKKVFKILPEKGIIIHENWCNPFKE